MFSVYKPFHGVLFSVLLIYLHCGAIMSWSSPVLPKVIGPNYTDDFFGGPLTTQEATWMASLLTLGAALGTVVSGCINTRFGRKTCTLLLLLPSITGYTLMSTVRVIEVLYFARLFAGLTLGGITSTVGPYICEVASKRNRGSALAVAGTSVCLGYIFSYSIGPYLTILNFNIAILIVGVLALLSFFALTEESPHYFILVGNMTAAERALRKYRLPMDDIKFELLEITDKVKKQKEEKLLDIVRARAVITSFLTIFVMMLFQNLTGISAVQYYTQTIFEMIGSSIGPEVSPIIVGSLQFLGSATAYMTYDRLGRKTVLYISSTVLVAVEVPLGLFCYLKSRGNDVSSVNFLPVLCLGIFAFFYNYSWSLVPWLIAAEIFPARIKIPANCALIFLFWITEFIITKNFAVLVDTFGIGVLFWFFASSCLVSIFFVWFFVVETKGKTLEEIQDVLRKK